MQRLRSVLYVPGTNERALEKSRSIGADALVLDLEDAVAPSAKAEARGRVAQAVASGAYEGKVLAVRVNGIGTTWHRDDLQAVASMKPDAVVVPKVGCANDVHEVERALAAAGASDSTQIWAMIETPAAVLRAEQIADASARLTVLVMGTNDLVNELHAEFAQDRAPLLTSMSLTLLAARATRRQLLDGVYNDVGNADGFAAECRQARSFGFDGKTLIHPSQVEPCNRAFSPSDEELSHARRVVSAFEEAGRAGAGVATVDGRMIENLHVEIAKRVLSLGDGNVLEQKNRNAN